DGPTAKQLCEHALRVREAIEPFHQVRARFAFLQAAVQFIAEFQGQTGDLSSAGHIFSYGLWVVSWFGNLCVKCCQMRRSEAAGAVSFFPSLGERASVPTDREPSRLAAPCR